MEVKILGTGCSNCKKLEANTNMAIKALGIEANITKVEDIKEIMKYGVMQTPAIVINEKVKAFGKVLTPDQIKKLLEAEQ